MGELIGLLVFGPVLMLMDYFAFIKRLDQYEAELTKASHGVAMIVICLAFVHYDIDVWFEPENRIFADAGALCVGIWGGFWLAVGASRTRWYRVDAKHAARAVFKIAFGAALLYAGKHWRVLSPYQPWAYFVVTAVGQWCVITGVAKFCLVMRGVRGPRIPPPDGPYGPTDSFSDGENLR
jgi:hypothetical protein